ncbi:MAG: S24/S26 family peptidase [Prevotella sp.]|nr:S24/S26 family peptidase [Prevotella sp.]
MSSNNNPQIAIRQLSNSEFLPFVVERLKERHTATLPLRGQSMRPFIEDRRDKALLQIVDQVQTGDVVLAEISKGHFVLHRIIKIKGEQVTLRGDGNLGNEHCTLSNIHAKAIGFYRKGRQILDSTDGFKWRIYSWWWLRLYPIRRYLLFILYPHIPQRFKYKQRI